MKQFPLVYIIILNYNGYKDTIECVESLKNISYKNCKIIIVDNASKDNSEEILRKMYPDITLIQSGNNLGYAGGNNLGIKYALGNSADYVCILNNDVVIEERFLDIIIDKMESNSSIGMAGPKICEYFDRSIIQSTGANINLYTGDVSPLNYGQPKSSFKDDMNVDYIGGACMIVRKELFEKIGMIPEEYFLFFEETEWCLKATKNGYQILCICASEVYHKGSSSIKKVKGLTEYYMTRNRIVFEKRNASNQQFTVFFVYNLLKFSRTMCINILKGKPTSDLLKGFMDGVKYKAT